MNLILSPGGSEGLFAQKTLEITDNVLSTYKNQGWLWQTKLLLLLNPLFSTKYVIPYYCTMAILF